jgi:chromosome segregation ATPase
MKPNEIAELVERLRALNPPDATHWGLARDAASALEQQRQTIMELNYQVKNSDAADKARIEQLSAERDYEKRCRDANQKAYHEAQDRIAELEKEKEAATSWGLLKRQEARIAELEGKLDTVAEMGCANCAPTRAEWKKAQARIAELEDSNARLRGWLEHCQAQGEKMDTRIATLEGALEKIAGTSGTIIYGDTPIPPLTAADRMIEIARAALKEGG